MKNIKSYLTILHLFLCSFSFCQSRKNLIVEYDLKLLLNTIGNYNAKLLQNDSISIFKYSESHTNNVNTLNEEDGNYKIVIKDTTENIIYSDKHRAINIEVVKGFKDDELFQIIDTIKNLKWEIKNETKVIQKYASLKATTKFKGREYTAWFTTEIPSFFGPLKLHGLPGLILELSDAKKEVLLIAKKISYDNQTLAIPKLTYKKTTRKEYNTALNNEMEKFAQNISSKFGRGIKVKAKVTKLKTLEIED